MYSEVEQFASPPLIFQPMVSIVDTSTIDTDVVSVYQSNILQCFLIFLEHYYHSKSIYMISTKYYFPVWVIMSFEFKNYIYKFRIRTHGFIRKRTFCVF